MLQGEPQGKAKANQKDKVQKAIVDFARTLPGSTERWARRVFSDYTNVQAVGLWLAAFLTGLIAVAFATLFKNFEHSFLISIQRNPILIFIGPPASLFVATWIVRKFAPEARGSGIPQVMAAIDLEYEGPHSPIVNRLLSLKMMVAKILSSLVAVLGGGAIGREGPTLQISASIFHFCGRFVRRYYPQADEKIWIIAGASAGLASAFNTPLGGIVYAIEEIGREHFHRVKTVLLTSVIVSGLVAQWLMGPYLYLGYPRLQAIQLSLLPYAALVGLIAGTLGALFGKMLFRMSGIKWRSRWWFPILCGFVMSALIYFEPLSSGSGATAINDMLFNGRVAEVPLFFSRVAANLVSYLSGTSGGIFSPALASGAAIGSFLSNLFNLDQANLMTLLGMIGFLTGITHTPFTSFILVLEMTDRHSAIFPMMVTALIAHGGARAINQVSFYEAMKVQYLGQTGAVVH